MSLPLLAQTEPTFDPQTDPKVIFEQNFENDFDVWANTPVDTINGLDYFKTSAASTSNVKIWENKEYQTGFVHKDTVIDILNGVKPTGSDTDIKNGAFDGDSHTIRTDAEGDLTRQQALDAFGINGGKKYFQYFAGDGSKASNASGGLVPEYRRNLFVRLTPGAIDENSSYRVTMYLKTTKLTKEGGEKNSTPATFRAELMRGFFNSEKDFSMGRDVSSSNTFTYSKNDFEDGEWTKITYMTYFLTNEIAEQFCYYNGFHSDWGKAWKWKGPEVTAAGFDSLCIIRQPNKFFLRISFRGDSTVYDLDNVSLTKSTIGGIQHTGNMLRVDFGYDTNLKDQAKAAKERTNIAAVEVPGKFFTVWGKDSTTHKWRKVEINTAEYHDDGYMYMWSKPRTVGGVQRPQNFDGFDEVRVDFTNPSGEEYDTLALKYNGTLYPNALDEAWVAAGKRVFDFKNELSTPNPNISKGVYPLKQYPPVIRPNGAPYEDGAFGLDGSMNSIKLIMSRKIQFDPADTEGSGNLAFCQVFKDGKLSEIWPVSESTDTYTIFKRQKSGTLNGEYTFKFVQLKGVGSADYGDDIVLNYEFGTIDRNPQVITYVQTHWAGDPNNNTQCTPIGTAIKDGKTMSESSNPGGIMIGDGSQKTSRSRFMRLNPEVVLGFDGTMYLSGRNTGTLGRFYYGLDDSDYKLHLPAGTYSISFTASCWVSTSYTRKISLYIYKKTTSDLEEISAIADANKQLISEFKPSTATDYKKIQVYNPPYGEWNEGEAFVFDFSVDEEADYILEWVSDATSSTYGMCMSDFKVTNKLSSSAKYVTMINKSVADAEEKKTKIDAAEQDYKGAVYNTFASYLADVKANIFSKNNPSEYVGASEKLNDHIKAMQARMDTVDLYYTALDTLDKAITAKTAYSGIEAYTKLTGLKSQYSTYAPSRHTSAEVSDAADMLNAGIKNLNDRISKTEGFAALLASTKEILDSTFVVFEDPKLEGKDLAEYDTLKQVYEAADAKKTVLNTLSDDEFFALADGMDNLQKAYLYGMDGIKAKTRQIRELFALADSLGYDFGGAATKDSLKNLIAGLRKRDAVLENVIREAVILQIYKKFAAGQTIDSLDVSALIPNYFLYSDGIAGENMEQKSGVWVVKNIDGGNSTALPGWTITVGGSNGYWMPTNTKVGAGDGHDWFEHAFIGGLRCGPQTSGTITSDAFDIPAGYYLFGLYGYNQTSNVALELVSDSAKIGTGDKTSLNSVFSPTGKKFGYTNAVKDSVKIAGKTTIKIDQTSGSGSEFDMRYFILSLRGALDTDYAALVSAQEAKLTDLITFVPEVAADAVAVQYFNLNGVQIAAPEAGKIVIKRTILSNGVSIVEKILVK